MKNLFLTLLGMLAFVGCGNASTSKSISTSTHSDAQSMQQQSKSDVFKNNGYAFDSFVTPSGRSVNIIFVKHGSIILDIDNYIVYIDPVTMFGNDFSVLPKADMILVTHGHHDHFDKAAIDILSTDSTRVFSSPEVAKSADATALGIGQTVNIDKPNFAFTTVPAYNISEGHLNFHPKARGDLGFVFDIDGFKIYVAGDTEDIPEMTAIGEKDIDVAFIPVNQPYTMTPAQAIHAAEMLRPRILYPYHYGETDLKPLVDRFADGAPELRIRALE